MPNTKAIVPRLPVSDLKKSIEFYQEQLGFTLGSVFPEDPPSFAILLRDKIGIQLIQTDEFHPAGKFTIWLDLEEVLKEHEKLHQSLEIEWGPEIYGYGRREFAILDPDGHRIIFSEETDEQPTCEET